MSDISAYFSHKWSAEFLPLNTMLWAAISRRCSLLLDQPQPTSEGDRPYYVSRLEFLMRHADVMVCCLPGNPNPEERVGNAFGDYRYNVCSPYILFELRLAERLDLPRLILFDRTIRFRRPAHTPPHVRYIERNFTELNALTMAGKEDDQLIHEINIWIDWVAANRTHSPWIVPHRTACLLAPGSALAAQQARLDAALDAGGFDRPENLAGLGGTDSELYTALRNIGLLVVDLAQPALLPLYYAAHSLMVPTIRLAPDAFLHSPDHLPPLLRGHPAGYQKDLVVYGDQPNDDKIDIRIRERAQAVVRATKPIFGTKPGTALLHRRTYPPGEHFVFISHNEKPDDRRLVECLVNALRDRGVTVWEYAMDNRAGENWRLNMESALKKATILVALVAPRYEKSDGCLEEWNYALGRIPILPFLTRGRSDSTIVGRNMTIAHECRIDNLSPEEQAALIATRVADEIRNPSKPFKLE